MKARARKTGKGRPPNIDNYVVRLIAELIRIADAIHDNEEVRSLLSQGGIEVERADGKFVIVDGPIEVAVDGIAKVVGRFICGDVGGKHLKRDVRPYILRHLADALEGKASRDTISEARKAWRDAQARYLPSDVKPTFAEVARENPAVTRRDLKEANCLVRRDKRGPRESSKN